MILTPQAIDGIELTDAQRDTLRDLIRQIITQARHPVDVATNLACRVFKNRLYEVVEGRWRAREVVALVDAKAVIRRGKCWRRERREETSDGA